MAVRRAFRATLALSVLLIPAACVSQPGTAPAGAALAPGSAAKPGTATYNCADGGMMTIQNLGTSLRLFGPDGVTEELPASPAGQTSRYGQDHDAIVIDGDEALVMTGGHAPLTCTR